MNAIQMSAARKLNGFKEVRAFLGWNEFIEICLGIGSAEFKRWDLVQLRCSNFMSCSLAERLALTLLELSDNFGVRDAEGVRLTIPARHKVLANLAGASRPRVSEHLTEFEDQHFITRGKRQLIVKRDRLESFLSGSRSHLDGASSHLNGDSSWA
jgi:hypothetical protein